LPHAIFEVWGVCASHNFKDRKHQLLNAKSADHGLSMLAIMQMWKKIIHLWQLLADACCWLQF